MGTLAETAIVNTVYRLPTKEIKLPFSVSEKEVAVWFISSVFCIYIHIVSINIYILPFQTENRNRKPKQFFFICLLLAYHATGNLSFVRLLMKKQREFIHLQRDETD